MENKDFKEFNNLDYLFAKRLNNDEIQDKKSILREQIENLLYKKIDKLSKLDNNILNHIIEFPDLYRELIDRLKNDPTFVINYDTPTIIKKCKELVVESMIRNPSSLQFAELEPIDYDDIIDQVISCEPDLKYIRTFYYWKNEEFILKICQRNPYNFLYVKTDLFSEEFYNKIKKIFLDANIQLIKESMLISDTTFFNNNKFYNDIDIITQGIKLTKKLDLLLRYLQKKSTILEQNADLISELLIQRGYYISVETPSIFTTFKKLQIYSAKIKPDSFLYMPAIKDDELFEIAINQHPMSSLYASLKYMGNPRCIELLTDEDTKGLYLEIVSAVNEGIKVSNMNKFINMLAEKIYEDKKASNPEIFTNVYASTMTLLHQCKTYTEFIENWGLDEYIQQAYGNDYTRECIKPMLKNYYYKIKNNMDTKNEIEFISKICRDFGDLYKRTIIKRNTNLILRYLKQNKVFIINPNSEKIRKLIIEKKQKQIFFNNVDNHIKELNELRKKIKASLKLKGELKETEIDDIIDTIFIGKQYFITEPLKYKELLLKIEIDKVINRLNSGNIDESSIDYIKYKNYIKFRKVNNKKIYYCDSINLTKGELLDCEYYIAVQTVIKQTNKFLMPLIKKIEVQVDEQEIEELILNLDELPFDDDNYIFNKDVLETIKISKLMDVLKELNKINIQLTKQEFNIIKNLLFKDNFLLISLFSECIKKDYDEDLYKLEDLINLIKSLPSLLKIYDINTINLDNIKDVLSHSLLLNYLSLSEYNILGENIVNQTIRNNAFNIANYDNKKKLQVTLSLYLQMITKNNFTVPRVQGNYLDYSYSIMDQDDPHMLTCGFETDACFRVGGNDNDFLHYCCLDKNGFIIKITDKQGNFIGRAAGFRNGNALFINQLRTIYDLSGTKSKHIPLTLKRELMQVLKACCDHIIESTTNSKEPIDFITITRSYTFADTKPDEFGITMNHALESHLQDKTPIDIYSDDYRKFNQTDNLLNRNGFQTDYTSLYGLICISSRYDYIDESLFKPYDPTVSYKRHRKNIETTLLTESNYLYFDRLNSICDKVNKNEYNKLDESLIGKKVIYGTNWFIIYDEEILFSNYLETDKIAVIEYNQTIESIKSKKR